MTRLSDLKESRTLTKEDVDPPVKLTIVNFTREKIGMEGQQEEKWIINFKETSKGLALNVTNNATLAELFGNLEIDEYKGKVITLWSDPNVMFAGKKVGGIRIRGVEENDKPFDDDIPF